MTSTADTTAAGTLRAALVAANSATTTTTITFDPVAFATPKTITLAGTQLTLTNTSFATTVTGPAAGVTISGNDKSRVFQILTNVTATMSNVTITKGAAVGTTVPTNRGGGIENYGKLTLFNSSVVGNRAIQAGGGINEDFPGVVTLTNVTIAGNTLSSSTGTGGGISAAGTVTLNNVTVSGNTAARGGGMCINNAANRPFTLANSIVAQNNATSSGQGDGIGAFVSKGHNLIGSIAGSSGWIAGDYTGTAAAPLSAKLGTLANNGGATFTLLPLTGSPAIDKGSNALVPAGTTKDQRGQARVSGTSVDIGAVEVQVPTVTLSAPAAQTAMAGLAKSFALGTFVSTNARAPYTITVDWGDGTAKTVFTMAAPGTITPQSHAYATIGNKAIGITVADAGGVKSTLVTSAVAVAYTGKISGTVFNDANSNSLMDAAELGLGLWQVYVDANKNGKLDTGEVIATTDADGVWSFSSLAAGTYVVRIVQRASTATTTSAGGTMTIALAAGQQVAGKLFGEKRVA